jgi:hypothetical protein
MILQCIWNRSSKSLSHFFTMLERYEKLIQFLLNQDSNQHIACESLKKFWGNSRFLLSLYLDEYEARNLLSKKTILNWALKEIELKTDEANDYKMHWDIILNIFSKMASRANAIKKEMMKVSTIIRNNWFSSLILQCQILPNMKRISN